MRYSVRFILLLAALLITTASFAADTIKIASWNIQNFGKTKAEDENRMSIIADVLAKYDLIAVQEVSNIYEKSDEGCPRNENTCPGNKSCDLVQDSLKKYLSQKNNKNYGFIFSPHIKDERYLFVYDKNKIEALTEGEVVTDEGDSPNLPICDTHSKGNMVRQPFYVTFIAGDFTFTLVTAHSKPDNNISELEALEKFYRLIQNADPNEDDVILLGDLNADCSYLKENQNIALRKPKYTWVIDNANDSTVKKSTDCAYDRIIFTKTTKGDYTGKSGVFRFDEEFGITKNTALKVSDHYPVWADFYTDKDSD